MKIIILIIIISFLTNLNGMNFYYLESDNGVVIQGRLSSLLKQKRVHDYYKAEKMFCGCSGISKIFINNIPTDLIKKLSKQISLKRIVEFYIYKKENDFLLDKTKRKLGINDLSDFAIYLKYKDKIVTQEKGKLVKVEVLPELRSEKAKKIIQDYFDRHTKKKKPDRDRTPPLGDSPDQSGSEPGEDKPR